MSVPQIKDRPASALRAMFAGIGSLLSGKTAKDKMRVKPAAEAPADVQAPASQAAAPETIAPDTSAPESAATETALAPETAPSTPAEPEAAAAPETVAETETPAEPESVAAAPLANYDELTVASLRARLRNLSNDELVKLKEYEQAHQNRPEVVKMFSNRLIKMTTGMPKLES